MIVRAGHVGVVLTRAFDQGLPALREAQRMRQCDGKHSPNTLPTVAGHLQAGTRR